MTLTDLPAGTAHEARTEPAAVSARSSRPRRRGRSWRVLLGDAGITVATGLVLLPFLFTVVTALRPSADVAADPLGLPTRITLDNFAVAAASMHYLTSVLNSLVVLLGSLAGSIVLGSLAAYPLSRITRGWTTGVYRLFVAGATVPVFVIIAPLYLLERDLGLLNTHAGVVLAYSALNLPVAVFFYTSFFRQVPLELEEAAAIDGAGPVRTFFVILFPLLRPVTATLATFLTLAVWNDLVIPLVFLHDPAHTTVMVNAYSLVGTYSTDPTVLFPAALLGVAPLLVVFVLLQRHVVAGLTSGAVKL